MYYECHYGDSESNISNWLTLRPFQNKKVRITRPYNQTGYYSSIQLYTDTVLGPQLYTTYENNDHPDNVNPYPMYIFCYNENGNVYRNANNIVIYEAEVKQQGTNIFSMTACQLTQNISPDLAWDNQPHYSGEYGMYDEISGKFFGNANSTGSFIENID